MTIPDETTNDSPTGDGAPADETFGWTETSEDSDKGGGPAQAARDVLTQIQSAVENVAEKAGPVAREIQSRAAPLARELAERAVPVAREVGARAAGLAAMAGEKAGPLAAKAASVTADAGVKLAERSREVASELRRAAPPAAVSDADAASEMPPAEGAENPPA